MCELKIIKNIPNVIYDEAEGLSGFTIYHTKFWHNFIYETFGWQTKAIIAHDKNKLVFFLPYISKKRYLVKKCNISIPFSHKIGIAFDENFSLNDKIFPLKKIEIHDIVKSSLFIEKTDNFITKLGLNKYESEQHLFESFDYKSIRYMINRSKKQSFELVTNSMEAVEYFYSLELETRHRQGAPIYPIRFFKNLLKCLPQEMLSIYVVKYNGQPISGSIFFHFKNETIYAYSASINDTNIKKLGANELVLWEGIRKAYSLKHQIFDFGTTPKHLSGLLKYKEKWNATTYDMSYSYLGSKNITQVSRDAKIVNLISLLLSKSPIGVFKIVSPFLLKAAI
jgi:hypothetical protein